MKTLADLHEQAKAEIAAAAPGPERAAVLAKWNAKFEVLAARRYRAARLTGGAQ